MANLEMYCRAINAERKVMVVFLMLRMSLIMVLWRGWRIVEDRSTSSDKQQMEEGYHDVARHSGGE